MKNIGGSLLPSSSPHILKPIPFKHGRLQVYPWPEMDTHYLAFVTERESITLASHPNGFSCYALAERTISGNVQRVREQAEYIVRCGGTTYAIDRICEFAAGEIPHL